MRICTETQRIPHPTWLQPHSTVTHHTLGVSVRTHEDDPGQIVITGTSSQSRAPASTRRMCTLISPRLSRWFARIAFTFQIQCAWSHWPDDDGAAATAPAPLT